MVDEQTNLDWNAGFNDGKNGLSRKYDESAYSHGWQYGVKVSIYENDTKAAGWRKFIESGCQADH
jgi:hypothetical protein